MKENKVLSFDLLRVERNRGKLCKCDPPHLEVDPVNRIVTCKDCGATIDPLEALLSICKYNEQLEEYQREAVNYSDTSNRASCFVHRGYYHTRMEQFSHSVHKR